MNYDITNYMIILLWNLNVDKLWRQILQETVFRSSSKRTCKIWQRQEESANIDGMEYENTNAGKDNSMVGNDYLVVISFLNIHIILLASVFNIFYNFIDKTLFFNITKFPLDIIMYKLTYINIIFYKSKYFIKCVCVYVYLSNYLGDNIDWCLPVVCTQFFFQCAILNTLRLSCKNSM